MKSDIEDRCVQFSLQIISLFRKLEKDTAGRVIGKQLLRSGTSIGANIHEAQGGQSKPDFIAKMSIAHKEAYETAYWLRLVKEAKILPSNDLEEVEDESGQLVRILSKSLFTLKKGGQNAKQNR